MARDTADDHYESKFEFPLFKLITECAEQNDISYSEASKIVMPEYQKQIRYRDDEYELAEITKREKEWREMADKQD